MTRKIRLLYMEGVTPVRSQTVYHAVGYAMKEDTPDTIILVSPDRPYVCIGYHQDIEKEVDLEYCASHGLPVYRREVGGGGRGGAHKLVDAVDPPLVQRCQVALVLVLLFIVSPYVLQLFPSTASYARPVTAFLTGVLSSAWSSFADHLDELLTIVVIILITHGLTRLLGCSKVRKRRK